MSLQYIIDAYNIINHPQFIRRISRKYKDSRLALLDVIKIDRLCGSVKNKVTVVFDGHPDLTLSNNLDKTAADIIFSRKETADERIKKLAENSDNPKNTVVVSDDKEIRFFIKSIGGRLLTVEEFIGNKNEDTRQIKRDLLKVELTHAQMHKINEELRKIWLKE